MLALFAGFLLSGAAVFTFEQFDEGIRDPAALMNATGLPVLGAIPMFDTGEQETVLEMIQDPKSEISEAYLTVRANLAFSTVQGVPKTMMVTSSRPAEGKSTTSFALASVLARTGNRVVLIDAPKRA